MLSFPTRFKPMLRLLPLLLLLAPLLAQQRRQDPLTPFKKDTDTYVGLWRHGKNLEALKYLDNAITLSTDGVPMRWLYDRADLYLSVGRVEEAISEIEWLHYRRPAAKSALQLALFHQARGDAEEFMRILKATAERYIRFTGEKDDTENTIAILRIREILGENPRALFDALDKIDYTEPEDKLLIHMARGDLACRKYDYALAAGEYEKVLEQEPQHIDAQAGLVECYWKSSDPRLEKTKNAVLKINPNHPRALAIEVEISLDANQTAKAHKLIDRLLAVNRNSVTFLGYKAATYFLENNKRAMEDTLARALTINRSSAEALRICGRIASRHYRFAEGAAFQESALALDEHDLEARALLGFDQLRLGDEKRGRAMLEKVFAEDRFNVQVYNMLELLDKLERFDTVKQGPFILRMPTQERKLWGNDVLALLEQAHRKLAKDYQVVLPNPIHVQIFDTHDDFMVRSLGLPGAVGFLGICFGQLITMDTPSARQKGTLNWRATLWHEFAHVVTLSKTKNRMPRWLSEGISVYEETRHNPAWGQRPQPEYKAVVEQGMPDLAGLERYFTNPKTQIDIIFGYYASSEFVRFYIQAYGSDALNQALDAIGNGTETSAALVAAARLDEKALNAAFSAYMKKVLAPYKNLPSSEPSLLNGISDGKPGSGLGGAPFTRAMAEAQKAIIDKNYPEALRWLKEAEAVFPNTSGPTSPLALMIEVYGLQKDKAKQRQALEQLYAIDGTNWRICTKLAEIYREAKLWPALADVAERGLSIDPADLDMWQARRDATIGLGQNAAARAALDTLLNLDPGNSAEYRIQRVDLLLADGARSEARKEVLALLEDIPYSWEAQQRLLLIASP